MGCGGQRALAEAGSTTVEPTVVETKPWLTVSKLSKSIEICMINRLWFRELFGLDRSNYYGYFIDRQMTQIIFEYGGHWVHYPDGDHQLRGHNSSVMCLSISDTGSNLYTGSIDGSVIDWNLECNEIAGTMIFDNHIPKSMDYHNGSLAVAYFVRLMRIWDVATHTTVRDIAVDSGFNCIRFHPNGKSILSSHLNGILHLWSVKTGECLTSVYGQSPDINSLMFMSDSMLLTASDTSIKVLNMDNDFECVKSVDQSHRIQELDMNVDGSLIACCNVNTVSVLSWPDLSVKRQYRRGERVCFHCFDPHILAVGASFEIKVFNVNQSDQLNTLMREVNDVTGLRYTPDGSKLISISKKTNTIQIWDLKKFIR